MKKLITALLLCLPAMLFAQNNFIQQGNALPLDVLYIYDGQETTPDVVKAVKPDSILAIDVLKDATATAPYGIKAAKGVVIVTSKTYAVNQYQEVFSSYSDDLESWLTSHGKGDAQFRYFIDGTEVPKTDTGKLKLYRLKKENIEGVTMVQDEPANSKFAAKVKIVTKK